MKQNQPRAFGGISLIKVFSRLVLAVIVIMVGYYGWIFFRLKDINKQIGGLNERIAVQRNALAQVDRKDEVLTRQAQLKEFDKLIDNHVYWSQLLPELAKITLKQASYLSFQSGDDSTINLSVQLPDIAELDKLLQVFDLPKLNKYFRDVKIGGISKTQKEDQTFIRVEIQLKYDPNLIKYQPKH